MLISLSTSCSQRMTRMRKSMWLALFSWWHTCINFPFCFEGRAHLHVNTIESKRRKSSRTRSSWKSLCLRQNFSKKWSLRDSQRFCLRLAKTRLSFAFQGKRHALSLLRNTSMTPSRKRQASRPVFFLSDSCKNCDTFFSLSLQLRMFTCQHKNDLKTVLQSFLDIFVKDQGQGCMLVLYSLILSKGIDN